MPQPLIARAKGYWDSALPNDETKLRALLGKLKEHGQVLLVVDQPATVGALPVAVPRDEDVLVAYLPGLAMRRIADLHAGESKTDARGAYIIAEVARSLWHTLRSLKLTDSQVAALTMLCGFDEGLAGQITKVSNRIGGLLTRIHPALERVIGPHLDHPAMLDLLIVLSSARTTGCADSEAVGQPTRKARSAHGENLDCTNPPGTV